MAGLGSRRRVRAAGAFGRAALLGRDHGCCEFCECCEVGEVFVEDRDGSNGPDVFALVRLGLGWMRFVKSA